MLSNTHFYHRIIRKLVVGFGTLFNNIQLKRYNKAGTVEIERIIVPLAYATKEKFYARITQDPTLAKEVQMTLPRMSFELTSIDYDPLRKQSQYNLQFAAGDTGSTVKTVQITPYNFTFTLYIYARNTEDGTQIVEQILPYFKPDYTVKMDLVNISTLKTDVPIILDSINYDAEAIGPSEELRTLVWSLTFTMKAWMYGPITANAKIIRTATANTFDSSYYGVTDRKLTLTNGSGNYKIGELVYEGVNETSANASAYVKAWNNTANQIVITDVSGVFLVNTFIRGAVTNTSYKIQTFDVNDNQIVNLTVTPDPSTANINTAFGFNETTEYYPNIS
jgi:hypothetical protein